MALSQRKSNRPGKTETEAKIKMNIFEEELRRLFEDGMVLDSPVFSGQLCMAMVGTDCHVQIQFIPDADRDKYQCHLVKTDMKVKEREYMRRA